MLSIAVDDKETRKLFNTMHRKGKNLRPLFTYYAGLIKQDVEENFRREAAPADILSGHSPTDIRKPWPQLSSLTQASRMARGKTTMGVGKILQASNRLRSSIGTVRVITAKSLEYGTNVHYAATHHIGPTIRPKRTKYLAIPYPGISGRPREYSNTFFAKRSIFQNLGGGKIRPLFMLKKSVKIPKRPFLTVRSKTIKRMMDMAWKYNTGQTMLGGVR